MRKNRTLDFQVEVFLKLVSPIPAQFWANFGDAGTAFRKRWPNDKYSISRFLFVNKCRKRYIRLPCLLKIQYQIKFRQSDFDGPTLSQCWHCVGDACPAFRHRWPNAVSANKRLWSDGELMLGHCSRIRRKNVSSLSLVLIQYCVELQWPRGSALGFRPSGFESQILRLEDSIICFIWSFSGGSPGTA